MNNNQSTWCVPLKYDRGDYVPKQVFIRQQTFLGKLIRVCST